MLGQVQFCTSTCLTGYTCQTPVNAPAGQQICCGSIPNEPRCPSLGSPEVLGNSLRYCSLQSPNLCSTGYTCQQAQPTNYYPGQYLCCSTGGTASDLRCPGNLQPDMVGSQPRFCNVGVPNCLTGFSCLPVSSFLQIKSRIGYFYLGIPAKPYRNPND